MTTNPPTPGDELVERLERRAYSLREERRGLDASLIEKAALALRTRDEAAQSATSEEVKRLFEMIDDFGKMSTGPFVRKYPHCAADASFNCIVKQAKRARATLATETQPVARSELEQAYWDATSHLDAAKPTTPERAKALEDAAAENEAARREVLTLIESIWRAEYRHEAPNWKPLPDLVGMISQLDNMYAGIRTQRDEARWKLAALSASPPEVVGTPTKGEYP